MVNMLFSFVDFLVASASQHNIFFFFGYRLQQLDDVLEEEKSLDMFQDPTRIFSDDKSNFQSFPKTGKVLACKGDKNVYEIDKGLSQASITARFAFSISGMMCPPMLIYSYKRIPSEIAQRVPDVWSITATYKMFEEIVGSELITEL
jgi:hypothetical protein